MELNIHCADCDKYEPPKVKGDPMGVCTQYDAYVAIDKFLLNCQGANRKDRPALINPSKPDAPDPASRLQGLEEDQKRWGVRVANLEDGLNGHVEKVEGQLEGMRRKFDMLLEAVKSLPGIEKVLPTVTIADPEKPETPPTEPVKPTVRKVVKKKAKKKTKKKLDASKETPTISS